MFAFWIYGSCVSWLRSPFSTTRWTTLPVTDPCFAGGPHICQQPTCTRCYLWRLIRYVFNIIPKDEFLSVIKNRYFMFLFIIIILSLPTSLFAVSSLLGPFPPSYTQLSTRLIPGLIIGWLTHRCSWLRQTILSSRCLQHAFHRSELIVDYYVASAVDSFFLTPSLVLQIIFHCTK